MCVLRSGFGGEASGLDVHTHTCAHSHAYRQSQAWSAFGIPGKKFLYSFQLGLTWFRAHRLSGPPV